MPGVVLDGNVFLQALINVRGPAHSCLELLDSGEVSIHVSREVLAEVRDVLNRPKLRQKFATLTPERVEAFLLELEGKVIVHDDVPKVLRSRATRKMSHT